MKINANKRIISLVLALALCLQLLPVTLVTAAEADEPPETITAETVPETTAEPEPEATAEPEPETTAEPEPEATAEPEPETTKTDPWEIIAACGGLQKPYAFGPDLVYKLPETPGEGNGAEGENTYTVDSLDLLDALLKQYLEGTGTVDWSEDHTKLKEMTLEKGEMLILLSVTDPSVYQKVQFNPGTGSTGAALDLTKKLGNDESITFQGLGSDEVPFQGRFNRVASFTTERALFNALDYSEASFQEDSISVLKSSDSNEPIVAKKILFDAQKKLEVSINPSSAIPIYGSVFGEVQGEKKGKLTLKAFFSQVPLSNKPSGHAGMIANTVTGGTLTLSIDVFPQQANSEGDAIQIGTEKDDCHAGLLVGYLKDATLNLPQEMLFPKAAVQSNSGGAGGLVGKLDNASISLSDKVDLSKMTILGSFSGGIGGIAENASFVFGESSAQFVYSDDSSSVSIGGSRNGIFSTLTNSQYTGGIFGKYTVAAEDAYSTYDGTGFSFGTDPVLTSAAGADGGAGLLFGELELNGKTFTVSANTPLSVKIDTLANFSGNIGGLVGNLTGSSPSDTLEVSKASVTLAAQTGNAKYQGGLVGRVTTASVRTNGVTISATNPAVPTNSYYGFGGLVGLLGEKCVLNTKETTTVSTDSAITSGGGLVGEAKSGSVVRLSGITDLSNVAYTAGNTVGQLVANQNRALIFAAGSGSDNNWTYNRSTATYRLDDIGNYGQVIRLGGNLSSDLVTINDTTNALTFKSHGDYGTISSADDFALHAIAFTSGDAFHIYGDTAVNTKDVTLTGEFKQIDLSGTGIQGLTRDNGTDMFAGNTNTNKKVTFDGGGKTLIINTGEVYGKRNGENVAEADVGSGQCYRHGYYGLLGKVNSAIVQNLTIQTKMHFGADVPTYAGAVMGYVDGGNSTVTTDNTLLNVTVNTESSITYNGDAVSNVGGFIGGVFGMETGVKVSNSTSNASLFYESKSTNAVLGGAVGKDTYQTGIAMTFDNVIIGGSITSNVTSYAHVGGLVGDISASTAAYRNSEKASVMLKGVTITSDIETQAAKISGTTKYSSGGFLGYFWDNVDVIFARSDTVPAVTVSDASLTTAGSAVGGLCFAATGRWNMQGQAVAMNQVSIDNSTGDLGLLVCHGERQDNAGIYSTGNNAKALYLVMDTNWSTAYTLNGITIAETPDVYDEIVAYTAANGDIMNNDAGIISLRTTGNAVVMEENDIRNTYENRIEKFKEKTNPNSRYYYNLDSMTADSTEDVSSPAELLLWSVGKYCAENIRGYLTSIPTSDTITGALDMKGYSYYPVTVSNSNTDVNLNNATITFYNKEIEALEQKTTVNKSTRNTESGKTQHFAMHSGLLYNFDTDQNSTRAAVLTVTNSSLLGTVGMVGDGSGALICGTIQRGEKGNHPVKLVMKGLTLDGTSPLAVAEFNTRYAPLLINRIGSYATLEISGVTAGNASASATSLMGKADGSHMNLTFSAMKLADTAGRFTKATMLDTLHFQDQNNTAVYDFTKDEDWNGSDHIHGVTYGKEIGGTLEYADESNPNPGQEKYSQSEKYVSHTGNGFDGTNKDSFAQYLPYVWEPYNAEKGYHEIQVNGSLENINKGCGTYSDPYQISSFSELQSIAAFIASGHASKNWTLNIPAYEDGGESGFCSGVNDKTHATYLYDGSVWNKKTDPDLPEALSATSDTLTNNTVREYLCNAYYSIEADFGMPGFRGLGTMEYPFRGVVVGNDHTLTLSGTLPKGFIVTSYGSVVKGLTLKITGSLTVYFDNIKVDYTMENCFGGVMASVLGGDNIIENVDVTYTESAKVTPGVTKPYLVPIGGYVGLIQGGGVIFRGSNTLTGYANENAESRENKYFYVNPYVGRVLQGFAVNEGSSTLDNTEKNYQICKLDSQKTGDSKEISVSGSNINLTTAQALLIFTSVTNSGGAGNGQLRSYLTSAKSSWTNTGNFSSTAMGGKVRNASYANVGTAASAQDADYRLSLKDDFQGFASGNTSYLDTHYANGSLYNVCQDRTAYSITLSEDAYDMSVYGNGYRSIGPRYLTTAVCKKDNTVSYKLVNPQISGVTGNNARIQPKVTVKEYVDDEYHAIAVGGLFNTIRLTGTPSGEAYTTFQNVTIGGLDENGAVTTATISHEYWELSGENWIDATHKNWDKNTAGFTNLNYGQGRGLVAVGGFIGSTSMEAKNTKVKFDAINTQYLDIKGPFDAGGILGHTGYRVASGDNFSLNTTEQNYQISKLVNDKDADIVPSFHDCTFQSLNVNGGWMVGGYLGSATKSAYAPLAGSSTSTDSTAIAITFEKNGLLGSDSTIACRRPKSDAGLDSAREANNTSIRRCLPAAGGLIGSSSYIISVNDVINAGRVRLENVSVLSSRSAGGIVAWPFGEVTIRNVDIIGNEQNPNQVGDLVTYDLSKKETVNNNTVCEFSGGMVGYVENNSSKKLVVKDCSVSNLLIVASLRVDYPCYAGGIVGNINSGGTHQIMNCSVKNLKLANNMCKDSNKKIGYAGGLVARLQNGTLYGVNLLADSVECVQETARTNRHGNMIGGVDNSDTSGKNFYLAGVSIQNTKKVAIPSTDVSYIPSNSVNYIAYADYLGTAQVSTSAKASQTQETLEDYRIQGNISNASAPYVTTSPKGVAIPVGSTDNMVYLYGDGANPQIVNQIWEDTTKSKPSDRFLYSAPKGYGDNSWEDTYDLGKYCTSTFYDEMGLTADTADGIPNFRVLTVPLSEDKTATTKEIVGYLNLVTNNGYWKASKVNKISSTQIDQYTKADGEGYFVKAENATTVLKRDGSDFRTVGYDTGYNRFEMLTLTFTEAGVSYKVQIPIVVRRKLEIDFTATIKDSPSFREIDYEQYNVDGFKPKTTVGYGATVSALLRYTYNQAVGKPQEYSWQYLLDSGDTFPKSPGQSIQFYNPNSSLKSLPIGTQLVLLDCADNNKAYHHTVKAQSVTKGTSIPLSDFKDSDGNSFSHWFSQILGVTATEHSEGKWVETENSAVATIKAADGKYYCPWTESATGKRYILQATQQQPTETFYLVIHIPESSVADIPESSNTEGKNLNGYLYTSFDALQKQGIQVNVNAVRQQKVSETQKTTVNDPQENSECTYNFLSGYVQSLSDQSADKAHKLESDPEAYILLDQPEADGNYLLHMDLVDEITVVKGQKDTAETPLHFKADISLPNYAKGENDTVSLVTANGFPTGCYGTAEFYVYLQDDQGNKTYYKWNENGWVEATSREKAMSYQWEADGSNMVLRLGTANSKENAVSLAGIRELAKNGNEKFYVETNMDIHMSVPAAEQVIAGAITKGNAYTKLSYTTYLASTPDGFSSTNYVESKQGEVRYYQSRSGSSTLTHSANDPTQLGINCSDLASANGVIYTTGVYDLTTLSNAENLIKDANRVEYTLTLWQRQESGEYQQVTEDLHKYIRSVRMNDNVLSESQTGYQWTDVKPENGSFASTDPENSKRFLLPIRVQVNTDVETNGVTFANYQLRLTATLYQGNKVLDQPVNKEIQSGGKTEYIRYDYVTYTITRLLTSGYWGQQN